MRRRAIEITHSYFHTMRMNHVPCLRLSVTVTLHLQPCSGILFYGPPCGTVCQQWPISTNTFKRKLKCAFWIISSNCKIVPDMTYNAFGGTLKPTLLLLLRDKLCTSKIALILLVVNYGRSDLQVQVGLQVQSSDHHRSVIQLSTSDCRSGTSRRTLNHLLSVPPDTCSSAQAHFIYV